MGLAVVVIDRGFLVLCRLKAEKHFKSTLSEPGTGRVCKVVLDKAGSKSYNNTNWSWRRHLRGVVIFALHTALGNSIVRMNKNCFM